MNRYVGDGMVHWGLPEIFFALVLEIFINLKKRILHSLDRLI